MIPIARKNLLENTGIAIGADPGVVAVADIPNIDPALAPFYAYQYVRDAGQAYNMWIKHFAAGIDKSLRPLLDDCVHASLETQHVTSPSGNVFTGGLVEPKLRLGLDPDPGVMARPQNDGPPIRAIFLLDYAHWLLDHNNGTWVADNLWRAIHLDLLWIADNWNTTSYELWETVNTKSYWTASLQYHALRDGNNLARRLNRTLDVDFFESQAHLLLDFMQSFWDEGQGYMHANSEPGRNVDSATIHASVHNYDPAAGCDAATLQPCSDRALSNLKVIVERFKGLYPIAQNYTASQGSPTGMFYEDTFNGGQPWYFSIFACAEQLYYALNSWESLGGLNVTATSQPFFNIFIADIQPGTYAKRTKEYSRLRSAIKQYADSYIALAARYTPKSGVLYDGFNKTDGSPVGAPGLSWSYANALMAFSARNGLKPRSWGAKHPAYANAMASVPQQELSQCKSETLGALAKDSTVKITPLRFYGYERLQLPDGSDFSIRGQKPLMYGRPSYDF